MTTVASFCALITSSEVRYSVFATIQRRVLARAWLHNQNCKSAINMALKEDAFHSEDPSVSDPFPSRGAGRRSLDPPPRPSSSLKKLLTFKKADESPMLD